MTNEEIHIQYNKIVSSDTFLKSARYTQFLKYLVEQSLAGIDLKEHTIGVDLFKDSYSIKKNDGIVRVYMYNLRKKLDNYYSDIGKEDPILFELKKGSYNLKFQTSGETNRNNNQNTAKKLFTSKKTIVLGLIMVFLAILSFYIFNPKEQYCWNHFLANKKHNLCILANQIMLRKKGSDKGNILTKESINSLEDFIYHKNQNPNDSLELLDYSFYTKAIPYSIHKLTQFFVLNEGVFNIVPESDLSYEDTKSSNLIYIGQSKTMNVSKDLFLRNSNIFSIEKNRFVVTEKNKKTKYNTVFNNGIITAEYAMVSFFSLDSNNKAIYFVSNHDMGTMATIQMFTNDTQLKDFYSRLPSSNSSFNALFKVTGAERTSLTCELVKLETLKSE